MDKKTMEMAFQRVIEIERAANKRLSIANLEAKEMQDEVHKKLLALESDINQDISLQTHHINEQRLIVAKNEADKDVDILLQRLDGLWSYYLNCRRQLVDSIFREIFVDEDR